MPVDTFHKRAALLDVLLVAGPIHGFSSPALLLLAHIVLWRTHMERELKTHRNHQSHTSQSSQQSFQQSLRPQVLEKQLHFPSTPGTCSWQFIWPKHVPHPRAPLNCPRTSSWWISKPQSHTTKSGSVSQSSAPSSWLTDTVWPAVAFHICNTSRRSRVTHLPARLIPAGAGRGDAIQNSQ